jgi:hypothetical protein
MADRQWAVGEVSRSRGLIEGGSCKRRAEKASQAQRDTHMPRLQSTHGVSLAGVWDEMREYFHVGFDGPS